MPKTHYEILFHDSHLVSKWTIIKHQGMLLLAQLLTRMDVTPQPI